MAAARTPAKLEIASDEDRAPGEDSPVYPQSGMDLTEDRQPERPKLSHLLVMLRTARVEERMEALDDLAELVNSVYGEDGRELGRAVRLGGGITTLAVMLADRDPDIQQQALLILGNLCSDSVDPGSAATKRALLEGGGSRALLACVYSDDDYTLLLACGALQNLCVDQQWAQQVVHNGIQARLEELLSHGDEMVVRYASGALTNLAAQMENDNLSDGARAAVRQRMTQAEAERDVVRRAVARIEAAVRAIPKEVREERLKRHQRRLAQALSGGVRSRTQRPHSGSSSSSEASIRSYVTACSNSTATSAGSHQGRRSSVADLPAMPEPSDRRLAV